MELRKTKNGKCEKCGCQYHICECGISHFTGSANAEHLMSHHNAMGEMGGFFKPSKDGFYQPWECPAPLCPSCWHDENPDQNKAVLSEFVTKAMNYRIKQE